MTTPSARRRLHAFLQLSIDGYFADARGDMSWAHQHDPEWMAFTAENAKAGGALLFGRVTYEQMASFWPTPAAAELMKDVAEGMNAMPKYVASRTLSQVDWANTTLLKGDLVPAVQALLAQDGPSISTLGSGDVVTQLAAADLIESYQLVINPVVLGGGRSIFAGLPGPKRFVLERSRSFQNGNIVLWYAAKRGLRDRRQRWRRAMSAHVPVGSSAR